MDLSALQTLEKRIESLELKVTSKTSLDEINVDLMKPVLDSLHEVDTVLLSSLNGRERITTLLERVRELDKILDPSYLETQCNLDMKFEDVLSSEADLKYLSKNIVCLEELEPSLNSEVQNITANPERLTKLMSDLTRIKKQCNEQSMEFQNIVREYQESMVYLSKLFVDLEASITRLEIESKPKKVIE